MDAFDFSPVDIDQSEDELIRAQVQRALNKQLRCRRRKQRKQQRMKSESSSSDEEDMPSETSVKLPILTPNGTTPEDAKSEDDKLVEKLDPALVGMSVGLKHLYSGKEDRRGRFQWQTTIPEDVGKPAEDAETQKWALIVRYVKVINHPCTMGRYLRDQVYLDPSKVLGLHSIVIQSPLLKELLEEILAGYPGVTVGLERLEFSGKFEPLIHRWAKFTAAVEKLRQSEAERKASPKAVDKDEDGEKASEEER